MRKKIIVAILVIGFSGLVAQVILLRELLIIFYGNELSLGIILANWLILEAIGAYFLGKTAENIRKKIEIFVLLQILFSLFLPLAIYLTRILKGLVGVLPYESLGLIPLLYSSFFILALVSIPHAALFTFSCKLYSLYSKQPEAQSIGKVYIYETLGTTVGGIVFTYLLIPHFHSFQITLGVSLLNLILCIYLLGTFWEKNKNFTYRAVGSLSLILSVLVGFLIFSKITDKLHQYSIRKQWKNQNVVHYQNSIYGNLVVIKEKEQYTFFSNGIPIITTPTPDIFFVEEFAHLALLSHPHPEEVLILSGGAGGLINEILKHPIKRIDYAELDPLILKIIKNFPTSLTETELNNPKVNIKYMDGRLFLKKTPYRYDLILVGLTNPSDLQINRFFTKEFFSLVKKKLKEEGIVVISLPGSLTYLSEELKNLNACIINTLKEVFISVELIPGDSYNLFLAFGVKDINLTQEKLIQRLRERNFSSGLINPGYIEYKLDPRWREWFLKSLQGATRKSNQDFQPLGVFFSLSYWNALFSPYLRNVFRWFEKINLRLFFIVFFFSILIILSIRSKIKKLNIGIPFCIITTGFAGMVFDLVLIFSFQTLYGYVFHWLGILVTIFMVGLALGGIIMTSLLMRIKKEIIYFILTELALILFSSILPLIFLYLHPYLDRMGVSVWVEIIFLILSFLGGLLVGMQFPLANKVYLKSSSNLAKTAGLLYGADLVGGWLGGIVGGVILLPILGLLGTCTVVVMLKIMSSILLVASFL